MSHTFKVISWMVIFLSVTTLTTTKPIMVSFGTNKGPIVPRHALPQKAISRSDLSTKPAPVYELREDLPNPTTYKPLIPHQYRTKLFAVKPSPNLILGTPLDIRYIPSEAKYDVYKKTQINSIGRTYVGPQLFEKQPYEFSTSNDRKTFLQPSVSYVKPQLFDTKLKRTNLVPEIGIVYSSGVRYYVPQINYQETQQDFSRGEELENSVYHQDDYKYIHRL
ncbi:hypothetical protein WA026_003427 [Henosepilachna vigintioctopunctata]|uniref:Uncharacterized protein n=1 Tax=Henosepilachna vigintioctopunctata TaxID=420089 RepID=A0AAW1TN16_9CUCU